MASPRRAPLTASSASRCGSSKARCSRNPRSRWSSTPRPPLPRSRRRTRQLPPNNRARELKAVLQPKRTKYRKQFKGRNAGLALRGSSVAFGEFGLKATSRARMTAREIEAARRAMAHYVKRGGQIWIRVFPDVPISKKPLEVRMGSGKGNIEYWIARVQPGKVLFEMEGVDETTAREAFRLAGSKLSVSTMFVKRQVR